MDAPDSLVAPGLGRVHFHAPSRDEVLLILREIFVDEEYLKHGVALSPGDVVFDAGANIGLFSIYAHRKCGGDCTLFSFEPVPSTYAYLERNFREHGLLDDPRVHPLQLGLTRTGGPERATFTVYPAVPGNSTLDPKAKQAQLDAYTAASLERLQGSGRFVVEMGRKHFAEMFAHHEVECGLTTVAKVVEQHGVERIDLLKIDVEGAEHDIVDGVGAAWPIVRQVVLETHGDADAERLQAALRARGFSRIALERVAWAKETGVDIWTLYAVR